jgi:prepilin-type N-terminal cleavage/methylation domain-containing protein
MKRQKGFTLFELLQVAIIFGGAALFIGGIWVLCHFIAKFW